LAINAKGGELIGPKQKDRTTTMLFKNCFTKGEKLFKLQKPSWQLRGELLEGDLLFSQRKSIWNRGEFSKSWKCFLKSHSYTIGYLQKNLKRLFPKDLQKQPKWCDWGPKC
jgi:hypothetical protein